MKAIESLAKHVNDTASTIAKGTKEMCLVNFTERGVSKHEFVNRVVYTYTENDCIETSYIRWRGVWVAVDTDCIAYL
jgi:hypothetical protein